jgi:ParB family chromosome partitioning protein
MATLHPTLNAQRSDVFVLEPDKLTLVTDPASPLYDPRVHDDPDESLVRNIMVYGVIEPVIIRKNGDAVEVVAGRGRVKAALEANRRLEAEGKQPIRVPAIVKRGQDADMFGVLISENECRREDSPLAKSEKALRLINMGKTTAEVAIAFGVSRQSVESWLALGDVAEPVLHAVEAGEVSATAAAQLSGLAREKQVETFETLKAEGGPVTVERARKAVREGDCSKPPKMRTRKQVEDVTYHVQCSLRDSDLLHHKDFCRTREEGFYAALMWVLGNDADAPQEACAAESAETWHWREIPVPERKSDYVGKYLRLMENPPQSEIPKEFWPEGYSGKPDLTGRVVYLYRRLNARETMHSMHDVSGWGEVRVLGITWHCPRCGATHSGYILESWLEEGKAVFVERVIEE